MSCSIYSSYASVPISPRSAIMTRPGGGEKKSLFKSIRSALSTKKDAIIGDARGENKDQQNQQQLQHQYHHQQMPQDAPPAYSPVDENRAAGSSASVGRQRSGFQLRSEDISSSSDLYAFLSKFDTIFLIDDSASMTLERRWDEVRKALHQIVPVCAKHDDDGIEVYFLNDDTHLQGVTHVRKVDEAFRDVFPAGTTPTDKRISEILMPYIDDYTSKARTLGPHKTGKKPVNLIVITDGVPDSHTALREVLIRIAKALDVVGAPLWQVGVQFFQVGTDRSATLALRQLDDNLTGEVKRSKLRDIVDTCTFDAKDDKIPALSSEAVLKAVLGAVNKKFDKQVLYEKKRRS